MAKRSMSETHDRALRMTLDLILPEDSDESNELQAETWAVAQVQELMAKKRMEVEKVSCRAMWRERT